MSPIDPRTSAPLSVANHGSATSAMAAGETAELGTTPDGIMPSIGFDVGLKGYMWWGGVAGAHHAAMSLNADIVSISWFSYCYPSYGGTDQLAIKEILDSGTTIVAAAANGNQHCSGGPVFPFSGLYDDRLIVVTSTGKDDKHYQGAKTHSHYASVDLAAPGHEIMVANPSSSWPYYGSSRGTSLSAPLVAGTVGLMKSVNRCLRPVDVKEILQNSTDPIADAGAYPGLVGTGRLNANRAVALAQAEDYACPVANAWFDGSNCQIGAAPSGTKAFIWGNKYYYTPLPGNLCPYPGSHFDSQNCYVMDVPEHVNPFIWNNHWYYSSCATPGWTAWLDRDNPSGTGDYELRSHFAGVCKKFQKPYAIQCRTTSGVYWTQADDVNVSCDRDKGLVCRKSDQPDSKCEDYEVRFFCP